MDFSPGIKPGFGHDVGIIPHESWSGPRRFDPTHPRLGWSLRQILAIRLNNPAPGMESRYYLLGRMIYRFHLSPLAIRILSWLMQDDVLLHPVDSAQNSPACYDPVTHVITLDVTQGDACAFHFLREARLAWFMKHGLSTALDDYQIGTSIRTNFRQMMALHRVIEADQDIHALIVAWQMARGDIGRDLALWAWCHDVPDLALVATALDHQHSSGLPELLPELLKVAADHWFQTARPHQCDSYMLDWFDWLVAKYGMIPPGPVLDVPTIIGLFDDHLGALLWHHADQHVLPMATAQRLSSLETGISDDGA